MSNKYVFQYTTENDASGRAYDTMSLIGCYLDEDEMPSEVLEETNGKLYAEILIKGSDCDENGQEKDEADMRHYKELRERVTGWALKCGIKAEDISFNPEWTVKEESKTVYRVIEDTIEIGMNSHFGNGHIVGKPFPRKMTEADIEDIYFAEGSDGNTIADFKTEKEAIAAAEQVKVSTVLMDWTVPFLKCQTVRVEEVEIDEEGSEEYTGTCLFRCEGYMSGKWYAVMNDTSDDDWGTGSFDLDEAMRMLKELREDGEEESLIAVIENDVCIEEIRDIIL